MGRQHRAAAASVAEVEIVAVVDPALGPRPTFEDILGAPDVDALLIAAPTPAHDALVRAALHAGKHVLCEKPLTLDPDADGALGALAAARGLILQVGFWRRFAEPFTRLRDILASGRIGPPRALRAAQWDASPPPPAFCDAAVSGGLEIDCGVHEFDLARWLTGTEISAVAAVSPPALPMLCDVGDVDTAMGLARLAHGQAMTIDLTRVAAHRDSIRTEIIGDCGAAIVEFTDAGSLCVRHGDDLQVLALAPDPIGRALAAQMRAFAGAVRTGCPAADAATADDAAAALRAARAMRDARARGTWVTP